jgi:hypothetical protein
MALAEGSGTYTSPKKKHAPPPPLAPHHAENAARRTKTPSARYPWLQFSQGVDWRHESPELLRKMNTVGRLIGQPITIISGYRTHAEQRVLYSRYQSGAGGIAAQPGHSYHERGLAVDALVGGQAIGNVVPQEVFAKAGLHNLIDIGDAPHVQLDGGTAPRNLPQGTGAYTPTQTPTQSYNVSQGLTAPSRGIPAESPTLPQELGEPEPIGMTPEELHQTWQLIAQLPGASPESLTFAERMGYGVS